MFTEDDPYVGIDLDGCRDPITGKMMEGAQKIIDNLDSYTEVSPSGTGVKIICRGTKPGKKCRKGDIEMYEHGRFFTVTGNHLAGTPESTEECTDAVGEDYGEYLDKKPTTTKTSSSASPPATALTDEELREKALNAKNGGKFSDLWDGNWEQGYESQSEADLALCSHLVFWTGGDRDRVDHLFRQLGALPGEMGRGILSYDDIGQGARGWHLVWCFTA